MSPEAIPEFEAIFAAHAAFAWRVLRRFGVPERDLEDATQEAFVVVFKGLSQFEGRSSVRTWLYGICRRVAANHRSRAAHRREQPVERVPETGAETASESDSEGEAFAALAQKQSLALLEQLLARLPDEQREVFVLYEIEELTMREVAEALECPQNTGFARLYAARREIGAALERLRAKQRVA